MSISLMCHPSREHFVAELLKKLPEAEVVWDTRGNRWDTGRRSLLAHIGTGSEWALVVQDDAVLCRDFLRSVKRALPTLAPDHPASFYVGSLRPHQQTIMPALREAKRSRTPWLIAPGPYWGVALVLPTAQIPELVEWADRRTSTPNYDLRIEAWYAQQGLPCWYSVPSLVDHRPVAENPSLIKGRMGDRRAHYYIGTRSPVAINWQKPPLTLAKAQKADLEQQLAQARRDVRNLERQLARFTER